MTKILEAVHGFVWGAPALLLIIGIGLYISIQTGFVQILLFPRGMKLFLSSLISPAEREGVSSFQALCTALAATVGTGNLVGVAGALCIGGPGAIFWMWLCGLLGMATKYAEVVLAVRYRSREDGAYVGGPMQMIVNGLGLRWRWLAVCYCVFGVIASFGVGNMAQINAVISGMNGLLLDYGIQETPFRNLLIGLALALLILLVLSGGAKGIGAAAEKLIPVASAGYILLCIGVLYFRYDRIPEALRQILLGAFSPRAATGGMLGSAFLALRVGCSRGVFTNEAGMGTASIAHASAETDHPAQQGLMGIVEVFLDTILICTLTALAILVSGVPIPYGNDLGGQLTNLAFSAVYGRSASVFLAAALSCFAFATVLGWSLYGGRCVQFLFGKGAWKWFVALQTLLVILGSVMNTQAVWLLAETVNGLMAIPNLIALAALSPEVVRLTIEYKEKTGRKKAGGGQYANFHQRKPLRTLSHAEVPPSGGGCKKRRQENLSPEHRSARSAYS